MSEEQKKYEVKKSDIKKELLKIKDEGANLLLPSTDIGELSDWHAPVIDKVYLSADPKNGDVYPDKGSADDENNPKKGAKYRITAQGLRKLSVCAGIIWHPYETRRVDDRSDRHYVAFQAVGGIRKADGAAVWWKGEYDLDFEVIEEELIDQYSAKAETFKDSSEQYRKNYIDRSVRRDMIFKRKHKMKLAETGAINRVIRAILGLKNSYTKEELQKPFVMVRIVLRPDMTDEKVRAKLADAAIKAMVGIYGPETPIETRNRDYSAMGEVIDIHQSDDDDDPTPGPENGLQGEPTAKELFLSYGFNEKIQVLTKLALMKGYPLNGDWSDLTKVSESNLERLFDHLNSIKNDDIPF